MIIIDEKNLLLYGITDRKNDDINDFKNDIIAAIDGGITMLQIREKDSSFDEFLIFATLAKRICDSYGIPLIVNDNVEIAKDIDASGVHLGEDDQSIIEARKILGPDKIIGATAKTPEYARKCQLAGADYLGCGAVFRSSSKSDAKPMDISTLKEISEKVDIPIVAIGGINGDNVHELNDTGIKGVAVISGIFDGNIEENARLLKSKMIRIVK